MLLLAALLHLAGAAALPLLHAVSAPGPASDAVALAPAGGDGEGGAPAAPPHDEQHCLVCQAAHASMLPPDAPETSVASGREAAPRADVAPPRLAPRDAASLARAPPSLS